MKIFLFILKKLILCKRLKKNKKIYLDPNIKLIIGGSSHNNQLILKWNYQKLALDVVNFLLS